MSKAVTPLKLDGRCAVVTGSSRGFGAEIARTLAREGADVVVSYHGAEQGGSPEEDELARAVAEAVLACGEEDGATGTRSARRARRRRARAVRVRRARSISRRRCRRARARDGEKRRRALSLLGHRLRRREARSLGWVGG